MICRRIGRVTAVLAVLAILAFGVLPFAQANYLHLTVVGWGGDHTRSQMLALVFPWREQTRNPVEVIEYNGGIEDIRSQVESANVVWDVVDMEYSDFLRACDERLLEKVDHSVLVPGLDGSSVQNDFVPDALSECGVGSYIWATVYAYNRSDFSGTAPSTLADFFDVKKFPGKRGLRKDPRGALEWALMVAGIPADKVYETLGSSEGLDFAFAKLEKLKPHIVWWESGPEPAQLLEAKDVVMTAAWNGRLFRPIKEQGRDIEIVWDGQLWEIEMYGIPKGSPHKEKALEFIAYATSPLALANQSKYIGYGPARGSSHEMVEPDVLPFLPTHEPNMQTAIRLNSPWWAENYVEIKKRFDEWAKPALSEIQQRGARF